MWPLCLNIIVCIRIIRLPSNCCIFAVGLFTNVMHQFTSIYIHVHFKWCSMYYVNMDVYLCKRLWDANHMVVIEIIFWILAGHVCCCKPLQRECKIKIFPNYSPCCHPWNLFHFIAISVTSLELESVMHLEYYGNYC